VGCGGRRPDAGGACTAFFQDYREWSSQFTVGKSRFPAALSRGEEFLPGRQAEVEYNRRSKHSVQSAANTTVFAWAAVIYFLSALIYIAAAPGKRENWLKTAAYSAWAGFALHTFALALRWIESYRMGIGHAPLSNFYESIVFLAWAGVLFSLVMERRSVGVPGVFILPAASLVMFYASFSSGIER
jgi:hypothetical protein